MTERISEGGAEKSRGRKLVDEEYYGEVPEGVDATVYEQMKAAVADFIDRKITFTECYHILQALVNPDPDSNIKAPNEATKAIIQRELDLMYGSYL